MQGVDGRFERVATAALSAVPREKFIRDGDSGDSDAQAADPLGLERQFRFRFRARRIYYECLAVSYADLAKGAGGGRSIEASHTSDRPKSAALPAAGTEASANTPPEAVLTGSIEGMAEDAVWSKTQAVVHDKCRGSIERVAKMAIERKIRPESARWTGGLTATMAPDKQEQKQEQGEFLPSGNKKD
jgi:hypothetical protein